MQGLLLQGLLLVCSGSRLFVHAAPEDLCYTIEEGHSWRNGLKSTLNIQLDKDYEDWEVKFLYDTDVVNLEAWKGDVSSLSQREYTVSSKCYNNKLFACQILSFGYVLRHFPEDDPSFTLQLNNVSVPLCTNISAGPTSIPCPYEGMLEGALHCSLWEELTSFQDRDAALASAAPNGNPGTAPNGVPLGQGVSPNGSPTAPTFQTSCMYEEHPTNSSTLCTLWCQILPYKSGECLPLGSCPYMGQVSEPLLCDLWEEIQLATSSSSTPSTDLGSLLGSALGSAAGVPYTSCPYLTDANPLTACQLWCELRDVSSGQDCIGAPVCPYENATSPYDSQLCDLWRQLEGLKLGNVTLPPSLEKVTCHFETSPSYSTELCDLWCEVQQLGEAKECGPACPHQFDPEYVKACQYYDQLNLLQAANNAGASSILEDLITDGLYMGQSSGSGGAVSCVDASNPTSADLLCNLWCDIQEFYGQSCMTVWTTTTTTTAAPGFAGLQPSGDSGISTSSTTPLPCPYNGMMEGDLHCSLWEELTSFQEREAAKPSVAPNGVPLGPGTSPNGDSGAAPNGAILGPGVSPNGLPSSDIFKTPCMYEDHPTNSTTLCNLWCQIIAYKSGECLPTGSCPYTGQVSEPLLCDLWEEIQLATSSSSTPS